jgi:C4-dicarboxylate-specific signal transduction histidine kinase
MGRAAAEMTLKILEGRSPGARVTGISRPHCVVDWRQLRRWGIDESRVPAGCEIRYREQSFWALYWQWLLAGAAFMVLQSALIIALFTQLQRRQRAEESVQKQRFELARASRLAIAAELTGSIAHEINQPLGAILSNSDAADLMLESGVDRREKLREILADIRRDSLRASEVIRRLRALLGNHGVDHKPFELNDALREVESLLAAEARQRTVALDVRPAKTDVTIVGDRIQIQQVLTNLILNAMDAMADVPADRRTVRVSIEATEHGVDITVRDNGHGIAPEHLPRLFDSFFTTKPGGMGLGLSISRTLVEAHGGRLRVESGMGEGAIFHVELPNDDGDGVASPGSA